MKPKGTEEKLQIVKNIINNPNNGLAKKQINFARWESHYGISQVTLRKWVNDYQNYGVDGLVNKTGTHSNHKNAGRKPNNKNEDTELLKLQKENKLLKAKVDFLKKFRTLAESLREKEEK